jgi:hypothetical protein
VLRYHGRTGGSFVIGLVTVLQLTGCQSAKKVASPQPCGFPTSYQCQPVNNDAALQRIVDDLGADPTLSTATLQAKLGAELCAISLVLTGVEIPATDNPLTQRIRRIEDLGVRGKGPGIDPATVPCAVTVRGASILPPTGPVIGCVFTDGSQCQPVNNEAALQRIGGRLDSASTPSARAAILVDEGCAIDRVIAGVFDPDQNTPLTQRWNDLANRYNGATANREDLAGAQEAHCSGLHQAVL